MRDMVLPPDNRPKGRGGVHIPWAIHFQGGFNIANEDTRCYSQERKSANCDRLEGSIREAGGQAPEWWREMSD